MMLWALCLGVHRQTLLLQTDDVMQGRWALLHVIGRVVWPKHVKSRFGGGLERSGDRKPNRRYNGNLSANAKCGKFAGTP